MSSAERMRRVHGGPNHAELTRLGVDYDQVIDFSVSTNPYGPAPAMLDAIRDASLERYPDPAATRAREAVGEWLDVTPSGVLIGNGAADLLWAIARAFVGAGETALVVEPAFSELRHAVHAIGGQTVEHRTQPDDDFALDLRAIVERARQHQVKLVYLSSPSVPAGTSVAIQAVIDAAQRSGEITWVLDQSFLSLSEDHADRNVPVPGNVIVVRSLTKDHALPGLRVGYLVTTPKRAAAIDAQRPAWSSSAMAQAAAGIAPSLDAFVSTSRDRMLDDRRALADALRTLGLTVVPSRASYLLAAVPDVAVLRAALVMRHGVLIRDCTSFGLPGFMRLGARPAPDRQRLIDGLREEL